MEYEPYRPWIKVQVNGWKDLCSCVLCEVTITWQKSEKENLGFS